jgi:alginate O-acetyltransferase complex protein AlgI
MVFSTPLFLCLFLPLALGLFHLSPRPLRLAVLTALSLCFYAWSDPRFVLLLVWTSAVDYAAGSLLAGETRLRLAPAGRRVVLTLSLVNSVGLLIFFKYGEAFLSLVTPSAANGSNSAAMHIALPAGISFYTFESISYVVDIYRGKGSSAASLYLRDARDRTAMFRLGCHVRGFIAFLCYISQFPHLVAGPIIRFRELGEQLIRPRTSVNRFGRGTMRFCIGLGKKVLIADTLAPVVDQVFEAGAMNAGYIWIAAIAFALQIYFDFSGYSDMAIGLASMLGFRFPENFDSPYKSESLTEFWRRWHMTLSRWLRDYIYIPLGGNRLGRARTAVNLMFTMVLAGVWHGAGTGFLVWGALHGALLGFERTRVVTSDASPLRRFGRRVFLLLFLVVTWIFFRVGDGPVAAYFIVQMFNPLARDFNWLVWQRISEWQFLFALAAGIIVVSLFPSSARLARRPTPVGVAVAAIVFGASLFMLLIRTSAPFLYFRF